MGGGGGFSFLLRTFYGLSKDVFLVGMTKGERGDPGVYWSLNPHWPVRDRSRVEERLLMHTGVVPLHVPFGRQVRYDKGFALEPGVLQETITVLRLLKYFVYTTPYKGGSRGGQFTTVNGQVCAKQKEN